MSVKKYSGGSDFFSELYRMVKMRTWLVYGILGLFFLNGCSDPKLPVEQPAGTSTPKQSEKEVAQAEIPEKTLHAGLEKLTDIRSVDSSIHVELKYATADNFMGHRLYFDIDQLYLQPDVALRLAKCQQALKALHPDYSLLVYDGVRPLAVQQAMWDALDSIPVAQRGKFVSNPANGSIHNYGAAVDLTICDAHGIPLDMGAGYDDIREIAYPKLEAQYLLSGELTVQQVDNRKLLRRVMATQRFTNIPTEWWHFNACSRATAKLRYEIVQ
jgi:D-alanyl-D-alanine dipeptidase